MTLLAAGARPADVAVARAGVAQAVAARDAARIVWQDALALVDAPSELDAKIAAAEAAVLAAEEQLAAAQAAARAADLEQAFWGRTVGSLEAGFDVPSPIPGGGVVHVDAPAEKLGAARLQWNIASQRTWDAYARANNARATRDAARQSLADQRVLRLDSQTLRGQADAAEAAYRVAEAAIPVAQAGVDVLLAGAPADQIVAAEALVDQAEGAIKSLLTRRDQARIVAPQAGVVTTLILRPGEVVGAGAPIARLADLSQVTLTAYVPEPDLGRVQIGGAVQVAVDSVPDRIFAGTVTHIADQAEFTPRNVQTHEERANTVFAVKIALANPDGVLKPGMPADACLADDTSAAAGAWRASATPAPARASAGVTPEIRFSGTIETDETAIHSELAGRVIAVAAAEGDQVAAGQVLVELDAGELTGRRSQAEAAVAAARAELARVTAPPQPARIALAAAQVKQAEAAMAGTREQPGKQRAVRDKPVELDVQINNTRSQAHTAAMQMDLAAAGLKMAQVLQESIPHPGSDEDRTRRAIYDQNVEAAAAMLRAAEAQARGAQAALSQLEAIRQKPVALDAAVHRAEGHVAQGEAALEAARIVRAQTEAPAQPEAIAAAKAAVTQAEMALALLDTMLEKLTLRSPVSGSITTQAIHGGEVAQPGMPFFTVADLSRGEAHHLRADRPNRPCAPGPKRRG